MVRAAETCNHHSARKAAMQDLTSQSWQTTMSNVTFMSSVVERGVTKHLRRFSMHNEFTTIQSSYRCKNGHIACSV